MHLQFVDLDELEDDLEVLQNFNFPVKIFWWPVDQLIQTFDRKMQFWKSGQKFSKEKWRWRCSRKLHFPAKRKCSGGGRRNLEKWTFDQKILTGKSILIFGQKFSDQKFNSSYGSFSPENWKWVYGDDFTSSEEFDRKINFWFLGRNFLMKSSILPMGHFRRKIENCSYQLDFTSSEEFDRKINFDFWAEIFWWKVQFFLYFISAAKSKIAPINLISLPQKILTAKSILENWAEIFWGKVQFFLYFISAAKSKFCKFQNFIIPSSLHFQFILHTFLFHLDHFQPHFVSTTTFQKSTHHAFSP